MPENTENSPSLLKQILALMMKNMTERERKELERYDNIEFSDANEEFKEAVRTGKFKIE